jgi:hypothetical protein
LPMPGAFRVGGEDNVVLFEVRHRHDRAVVGDIHRNLRPKHPVLCQVDALVAGGPEQLLNLILAAEALTDDASRHFLCHR